MESAHIQGYINEKSHHPQNGILLRADFHKLFDVGLIHHERYLYDVMYPIKECDNFSIALETEQDCEITVKISIIKTELSCADFMTFILNKHVTEHEVYRYIESRPDKENNNFPWSADVYHFEVIYAFFKNTRDFSRECS